MDAFVIFWAITSIIGIAGIISLFFREFRFPITRGVIALHSVIVLIPVLNLIPAIFTVLDFLGYLGKKFKPSKDKISDWFDTPIKRWNE